MVVTNLSLAQLAERETVVFTAISRSSVRLREGRFCNIGLLEPSRFCIPFLQVFFLRRAHLTGSY